MSINFGNIAIRSSTWTDFKNLVDLKSLVIQYQEDTDIYIVYSYDGPEAISCVIWKGNVPDPVIANGYSQAQNDSDKSDFETNYKNSANTAVELYPLIRTSYSPDPGAIELTKNSLLVDNSGRLEAHATVLTDEGSFRDDFTGSGLTTTLTGTLSFTNGSTTVTGSGTVFSSELKIGQYIKKSADAETLYVLVSEIISDTKLILTTAYSGDTGSATSVKSNWKTLTATGGSISVTGSQVSITSGTTSGQTGAIERPGDYLPYSLRVYGSISQRIANQETFIGFRDNLSSPQMQTIIKFSGTNNTQATFITSYSAEAADTQSTTITLPNGAVSSSLNTYDISLSGNQASLVINGIIVATHSIHLPTPYTLLNIVGGIKNTGTAGSSTTVVFEYVYFANWDRIQVDNDFFGEPLLVKSQDVPASSATLTNVASSASNVTLLSANAFRRGVTIFNDSTQHLYVKYGATASTSSFTIKIAPGDGYEFPYPIYPGQVDGIWSTANGNARITEIT